MVQFERNFCLAEGARGGISCDEKGLFVGEVALLERERGPHGAVRWRPRALLEINYELSQCYGLPIEFDHKIGGLDVVARALDEKKLGHAQIATLHLCLPDPPSIRKSAMGVLDLARRLWASDLLKADWNPAKHPRWPAGSPNSTGGEFSPADNTDSAGGGAATRVPAQWSIPFPGAGSLPEAIPTPGAVPLPPEVVFPPIVGPGVYPREIPSNPYPDRPECVEEWRAAKKYCIGLKMAGKLGRDGYRGAGNSLYQCIKGQVSQDCGGNTLET